MERSRITRWAAPIAFLAAITIGALVVRSGLQQGKHHPKTTASTVTTNKKTHRHGHKSHAKTYTIETNDTLASIAAKEGTTVANLMQLNPGIDPTALQVGQSIRVR